MSSCEKNAKSLQFTVVLPVGMYEFWYVDRVLRGVRRRVDIRERFGRSSRGRKYGCTEYSCPLFSTIPCLQYHSSMILDVWLVLL